MAFTRRVSLFEREVSIRLAPVAVELIHGAARMLTEGELSGDGAYTGSTMLTVDLARTADRISDPPDAATAQRAALLYAADASHPKLTVFAASAAALVLTSALGVLAGSLVAEHVSPRVVRWIAGLGFIAVGAWVLLVRE